MKDFRSTHFLSGEFARLCKINKRTLHYYDALGIFQPELIMDNGYRYYSLQQLYVFHMIRTLQQIGMPLKEVHAYIERRSPEELLKLLDVQQQSVNKQMAALQDIQEMIQNKIASIHSAAQINRDIVHLQHFASETLVLSQPIEDTSERAVAEIIIAHVQFCSLHRLDAGYFLGAMLHHTHVGKKEFERRSYFFTRTFSDDRVEQMPADFRFEKPGGLYAVAYFSGDYDDTSPTYERLLAFISEENLEMEGYAYEESLIEDLCAKNPTEYVTCIAVKVHKK